MNNQPQKAEDSTVVYTGAISAAACIRGWRLPWKGLAPMALLAVMLPLAGLSPLGRLGTRNSSKFNGRI